MFLKMTFPIKMRLATLIVAFFSLSPLIAQEQWKFSVNQYDLRETHFDKKSTILGIPCITRLKFQCAQDGKGATGYLSMYFTISNSSKITGFDLGYFDGPGAEVGKKKLMRITLMKNGVKSEFHVGLSGTGSAEIDDGFVFETGTPTKNKNGYMRKIVDEILAGAESIEVAVVDGKDHSKVIVGSFPLTNGRQGFQGLLQGIK